MKLVLDTKTPLGVVTAERSFVVEDPSIARMQTAYIAAREKKNLVLTKKLQQQLLAAYSSRRIKPEQELAIDKANTLATVPDGTFSAKIKWFAEKDCLRAVIDVEDAAYVAQKDLDMRNYSTGASVFVSPSGADADILDVSMAPGAEPGKATVNIANGGKPLKDKSSVKCSWWSNKDGYKVSVSIPWKVLKGYDRDWKLLPVEASVRTGPYCRVNYEMTKPGEPAQHANCYSLLTRN